MLGTSQRYYLVLHDVSPWWWDIVIIELNYSHVHDDCTVCTVLSLI